MRSSVLVIGLGGLGSIASMYLAGAGVGRLILVDFDTVSISDLHRQLLYTTSDVGKLKVDVAKERLSLINPGVRVDAYPIVFRADEESRRLVEDADVVVLAVDNMKTRYDVNEAVVEYGKPLVSGGVDGWFGMVTTVIPGETPCLAELMNISGAGSVACAQGLCNAILGPVAGIVASWQALEAIRIAAGLKPLLAGKVLFIDALNGLTDTIAVSRNSKCPVCGIRSRGD